MIPEAPVALPHAHS